MSVTDCMPCKGQQPSQISQIIFSQLRHNTSLCNVKKVIQQQ